MGETRYYMVFPVLIGLFLLLTIKGLAWADSNAGHEAFYRGDYNRALKEWRPLAERGHPEAQLNLAYMYTQGLGVTQDYAEAVKWYRKAAEQGLAEAQSGLGTMYFHGQGVPRDYGEAFKLYTKAAAQNDSGAIFNLASMYAKGLGVRQNFRKAFELALKAANMDDIGGQFLLAQLNEAGLGVERDNVQALFWYSLVASKATVPFPEFQLLSAEASSASRSLIKKMTEEEVRRASKLIREWSPSGKPMAGQKRPRGIVVPEAEAVR